MPLERLSEIEIAVPGRMTTAFLVLRMAIGDFRFREVPFDQIMDEVRSGAVDAGLLIHEGQLTYEAEGFTKVLDLGEWWMLETGLPLPLGANVARRDLGEETLRSCGRCSPSRSAPVSRTAAKRWPTRWSSAAASSRTWPIGSSACT